MPSDSRSSQAWEIIEDRVFAFEQDCQRGNSRRLDEYLPDDGDDLLRRAVLIELVKVDLELQWKRGQLVLLDHYCQQYADLGSKDELPPDLVYEAFRVACQHGKTDSAKRFCEEYPQQRKAVMALAEHSVLSTSALTRQQALREFQPGQSFDDFELLALLGKGAFGQVFLARQVSLARQVALKISANRGSEARTMASLEHDNIVQVFSESVQSDSNARLLCMQYIPGTNLGNVIRRLGENETGQFTGADLVEAIDELSTAPAIFQSGALKERELLASSDQVNSICWIGCRLAEALAYAHQQGVLHRDIKPDNILISLYGRPMLADFNLSLDPHEVGGTVAGMFGGSLAYMSPEHLDAFNSANPTPTTAVDQRSDIYSLGIVLFELAALRQPFENKPTTTDYVKALEQLADERRRGAPRLSQMSPADCGAIEFVLERCLQPNPNDRYQSGMELADALSAAQELQSIQQELPKTNFLIELATRFPFRVLLVAALLPNLLGSAVNISYNLLRIIPQLNEAQEAAFRSLVLTYNLIVYPICVAWICALVIPIFRSIRRTHLTFDEKRITRQRLVAFPLWVAAISCFGWIPGGLLFPIVLEYVSGPIKYLSTVFAHFAADFAISGLIVLTYAYFGVETMFLRTLYPRLLAGQSQPREVAKRELRGIAWRLRVAQVFAGVIPLAGAVLLVVVGPDEGTGYGMFRILVSVLIGVGMLGFCLSMGLVGYIRRVVAALTGSSN